MQGYISGVWGVASLRGAADRRPAHRPRVVALGLLHQPALRRDRDGAHRQPGCVDERASGARPVIDYAGLALFTRRRVGAAARRARGRPGGAWSGARRRWARSCSPSPPSRRSSPSSGARPSRSCRCACSAYRMVLAGVVHRVSRRHGDVRRDLVRPALPPAGQRHVGDGGRASCSSRSCSAGWPCRSSAPAWCSASGIASWCWRAWCASRWPSCC